MSGSLREDLFADFELSCQQADLCLALGKLNMFINKHIYIYFLNILVVLKLLKKTETCGVRLRHVLALTTMIYIYIFFFYLVISFS